MADLVPGFQGGQEFTPSGGGGMSPEQKLADMAKLLQGAPNSVLDMLSRILSMPIGGESGQQWQNLHQMPPPPIPRFEGINGAFPVRPTEPAQPMPMMAPNPGFVRG